MSKLYELLGTVVGKISDDHVFTCSLIGGLLFVVLVVLLFKEDST
jgi:hypothetical protein